MSFDFMIEFLGSKMVKQCSEEGGSALLAGISSESL